MPAGTAVSPRGLQRPPDTPERDFAGRRRPEQVVRSLGEPPDLFRPAPQREALVPQTYRVRYSAKPSGHQHAGGDVQTIDLACDLDQIPGRLPADSYIMYIEDLTACQNVHWTRWPKAYRPGFGG